MDLTDNVGRHRFEMTADGQSSPIANSLLVLSRRTKPTPTFSPSRSLRNTARPQTGFQPEGNATMPVYERGTSVSDTRRPVAVSRCSSSPAAA
jgi:hypothetical protein